MLRGLDVFRRARQRQGIAAINDLDAKVFFDVVEVRIMLAVQKRQKRKVVEFKCSYCESPGYVIDYITIAA